MASRTPLTYTFGNHMHWVDMEWLWGYHVLPGSVRDMLAFCNATGAKGNVNFDGVGYERLASEDPEAFGALREAVRSGQIEVVGASYGQPYGAMHGGESNVRQRIYGVRAALRLFGVRPRTFWEEEFDFFPQLPQMLKGCGITGASLFFQWTWHTPEIPLEDSPVVLWTGHDGTTLKAATRNRLNLHQWPEDVDIVLEQIRGEAPSALSERPPLILQWLELMPSPDWMCRSEVLLPKTKELLSDPRFDVSFATLGEYLESWLEAELARRQYQPHEVFHGMSLGKNGDLFRRLSRSAESSVLRAECLAAVAGVFGRPYAQWDVYPTWELEEAWRELLQAQHHDNDECEGLCGHVGRFSYERSLSLSGHVIEATETLLSRRIGGAKNSAIVFNTLGWPVTATVENPVTGLPAVVRNVPPLGWTTLAPERMDEVEAVWEISTDGALGACGDLKVAIDDKGRLSQIWSPEWPEGMLPEGSPLLRFAMTVDGEAVEFEAEELEEEPLVGSLRISYAHPTAGRIFARLSFGLPGPHLKVTIWSEGLRQPDGGMNAGLQTPFASGSGFRVVTDSPYAVHEVQTAGTFKKKYPTGDWMTSEQWFEDVTGQFDAWSLVDLLESKGDRGLLIVHDGSPQWFRDDSGVRNLLNMYDPWDEEYWIGEFEVNYRLYPHGAMTNSERWKRAQEHLRPPTVVLKPNSEGDLPSQFSFARVRQENVAITALYRETLEGGRQLEGYAGGTLGVDYPYVMRLVELDGVEGEANLEFTPTVKRQVRTNLMGESLETEGAAVRPHEIATVMLDVVEGRKKTRDLDAKREIWATVHRTD